MNKQERDAAVIELRRRGMTYKEIAQQIGCSLGVVRKVIRQYPGDDIQKEQYTTAMSVDKARSKYCPEGFELLAYHPGQTKGYVELKCKQCGYVFTKTLTAFRGIWAQNKTHCRECDRRERESKREAEQKQIEQIKKQKEEERALAITGEQLFFNVCPVCSEVFVPSRGGRKYCSPECRRKAGRTTYRHTRRVRLREQIKDKDISWQALAYRNHDRCWICNKKVDRNDYVIRDGVKIVGNNYPSVDHVIPVSKYGLHAWNNVKLAHMACNRVKNDKIIREG